MTIIEVSTESHVDIIESLAREIWTEHYVPIIAGSRLITCWPGIRQTGCQEQIASGVSIF